MTTSDMPDELEGTEEALPEIMNWRYLPPVLDAKGCARLLGMRSANEVNRLARERKLPSVKFGKRVLYLTDEVIATLRKLQRPAIDDREFARRGRLDRVAEREE